MATVTNNTKYAVGVTTPDYTKVIDPGKSANVPDAAAQAWWGRRSVQALKAQGLSMSGPEVVSVSTNVTEAVPSKPADKPRDYSAMTRDECCTALETATHQATVRALRRRLAVIDAEA